LMTLDRSTPAMSSCLRSAPPQYKALQCYYYYAAVFSSNCQASMRHFLSLPHLLLLLLPRSC
jgi:hypothetical protein